MSRELRRERILFNREKAIKVTVIIIVGEIKEIRINMWEMTIIIMIMIIIRREMMIH